MVYTNSFRLYSMSSLKGIKYRIAGYQYGFVKMSRFCKAIDPLYGSPLYGSLDRIKEERLEAPKISRFEYS
jgi:hypothetical protein